MSLFDMTASTNVRKLMVLNSEFPKDLEVINSDTATFVADISEHGRPAEYTYQWYVNEEMVNDATTAVYSRDTTADKGVYSVHCVITNKAGSVKTRTATLTVNALPKLDSSKIVNATIAIGEPKTYAVSISEHGYPETYSYQWYEDGVKISGATSSSYSYAPTSLGKHDLYCEVTNSAGTVKSSTATITTRQYIYKPGNQYTSLTGGWTASGYQYDDNSPAGGNTVTTGYLQAEGGYAGGGHEGWIGTNNAINLTGKSKLYIDGITTAAETTSRVYISTKKKYLLDGVAANKYLPTTRSTISIDISKITGKHYIGFGASFSKRAISKVYNMWFE
jgi:hypothetical protein